MPAKGFQVSRMGLDAGRELTTDRHLRSFTPRDYLREYYSEVGTESSFLLGFLADAYRPFEPATQRVLELGGGPTLYQLISAARVASEIYFADYLEVNLAEVRNWKDHPSSAFDWSPFFRRAMEFEVGSEPTDLQLKVRTQLLRERIADVTRCDVLGERVVDPDIPPPDVVSTNFVAESITGSRAVWRTALKRIAEMVPDGGCLVMSGLLGASHWIIGSRRYPAVFLELPDVVSAMTDNRLDIEMLGDVAAERPRSHPDHQGYDGIFCVKARKH
jgi:NNMT/PNMT/TEMT family